MVVVVDEKNFIMEVIMIRDQRTTGHRVNKNSIKSANIHFLDNLITVELIKNNRSESKRNTIVINNINNCNNITVDKHFIYHCDEFDNVTKFNCKRRIESERHFCTRLNSSSGINNSSKSSITTWLRLSSLLAIFLVMSVQSAPTPSTIQSRRMNSPLKWVNPCGLATEDIEDSLDVTQLRDEQLLSYIVVPAKTALGHAKLFCDDYIRKTFKTDLNDLHSTWKDSHYDWLPGLDEIPKQLGEPLSKGYLDKLEVRMLDTALLNAYEYMQKYAVGLEQIVWDQEDYRLEFLNQFKETEFKLRPPQKISTWKQQMRILSEQVWSSLLQVLCELQVALTERGVQPRADVTRAAMSNEFRAMSSSATFRNLRDWLIFRDYMNGLEYIIEIFEHLQHLLEP